MSSIADAQEVVEVLWASSLLTKLAILVFFGAMVFLGLLLVSSAFSDVIIRFERGLVSVYRSHAVLSNLGPPGDFPRRYFRMIRDGLTSRCAESSHPGYLLAKVQESAANQEESDRLRRWQRRLIPPVVGAAAMSNVETVQELRELVERVGEISRSQEHGIGTSVVLQGDVGSDDWWLSLWDRLRDLKPAVSWNDFATLVGEPVEDLKVVVERARQARSQ